MRSEQPVAVTASRAAIRRESTCNQKSNHGTDDDNDHSHGERLKRSKKEMVSLFMVAFIITPPPETNFIKVSYQTLLI